MKNKGALLTLIFILMAFGQVKAQLVTDRPDQTESSSTVGRGNFQVESGFLIGFEGEGQYSTRYILAPTTLLRYGITAGIELRMVNQFVSTKYQEQIFQEIGDLEVGTKIQLLKMKGTGPEIAFLTNLIIPTGTAEPLDEEFGTVNKLAVSYELSEDIGLGYNIGYNYFGAGNGDLTYSVAMGISVNDKVGLYIEPYGEFSGLEDFILNFDTGFTYLVNDNLQFDFSFGSGLTHRMNYVSVGVSWRALSKKRL